MVVESFGEIKKESRLQFHHIGCLTKNITDSIASYKDTLGFENVSAVFTIEEQQVKVCFIELLHGVNIELIEPMGDNPTLNKILKSNNPYYHVGYTVHNFDKAIQGLLDKGLYLVNTFHSEAFGHKRCAFLYTPEMHLIEIIENPTEQA